MDQELNLRLTSLEERLKTVERALKIQPTTPVTPAKPVVETKMAAPAPTPKPQIQKQERSGAWLATVGVFFFILAASFFVKLAIDSGWLTPTRQLCGAALFGLGLIAAGWQFRSHDKAYAGFLPAAGVVVLFLTAYAGHLYWSLYSAPLALFFICAISLFALYLFKQFEHDFFLVASTAGSFLIPLLIDFSNKDLFSICIYFLFWDVLYCVCAIILGQRLLIALTAYFAFGVWFLITPPPTSAAFDWQSIVLFQTVQFVILASATALFSVKRSQKLTATEAWSFLPVLLLFYATQYSILSRAVPDSAPWISLGFAALLFAIYRWASKRMSEESLNSEAVVVTFICFTLFHSLYLELLPKNLCPWFGLALIPLLGNQVKQRFAYDRFWPAYWLIYAVIISEYMASLSSDDSIFNILFFAAIFVGYWLKRGSSKNPGIILFLSISQLLLGLGKLTEDSAYLVSSTWAVAAFAMLVLARQWRDVLLAKAALVVLAMVAAKVLLNDINSSNSLARIVALVVIGALMYGAGLIWRKISEWEPLTKLP